MTGYRSWQGRSLFPLCYKPEAKISKSRVADFQCACVGESDFYYVFIHLLRIRIIHFWQCNHRI